MIDFEKLNEDFLKAYHSVPLIQMARNIDTFLNRDVFIPYWSNKHRQYLKMEMLRHIRNHEERGHLAPDELPGMVYGMYFNAWSKLLADMKGE